MVISLEIQSQREQELEKQLSDLRRSNNLDFSNYFINAYMIDFEAKCKKSFANVVYIHTYIYIMLQ